MFLAMSALAFAARIEVTVASPVAIAVDGRTLDYADDGFVVAIDGLKAGRHVVEARTMTGRTLAAVTLNVGAPENIVLTYAHGVLQRDGVATTPPPPPAPPREPPPQPPPRPPAPPTQCAVEFVSRDGEWANIYVDGEKVADFRANDKKKSVTLTGGVHKVEIKDFMESTTWNTGSLTLGYTCPLKIGFGATGAPEVYNDPGAWK